MGIIRALGRYRSACLHSMWSAGKRGSFPDSWRIVVESPQE